MHVIPESKLTKKAKRPKGCQAIRAVSFERVISFYSMFDGRLFHNSIPELFRLGKKIVADYIDAKGIAND